MIIKCMDENDDGKISFEELIGALPRFLEANGVIIVSKKQPDAVGGQVGIKDVLIASQRIMEKFNMIYIGLDHWETQEKLQGVLKKCRSSIAVQDLIADNDFLPFTILNMLRLCENRQVEIRKCALLVTALYFRQAEKFQETWWNVDLKFPPDETNVYIINHWDGDRINTRNESEKHKYLWTKRVSEIKHRTKILKDSDDFIFGFFKIEDIDLEEAGQIRTQNQNNKKIRQWLQSMSFRKLETFLRDGDYTQLPDLSNVFIVVPVIPDIYNVYQENSTLSSSEISERKKTPFGSRIDDANPKNLKLDFGVMEKLESNPLGEQKYAQTLVAENPLRQKAIHQSYGCSLKRNQISGNADPEWYNKLRSKVQALDVHKELDNLNSDQNNGHRKAIIEEVDGKIFEQENRRPQSNDIVGTEDGGFGMVQTGSPVGRYSNQVVGADGGYPGKETPGFVGSHTSIKGRRRQEDLKLKIQSTDFTYDYYKPEFGFSPMKKAGSSSPEKKGFIISQNRTGGFEGVNRKAESIFDKMVIEANKKSRQPMDSYDDLGGQIKDRLRGGSPIQPFRLWPKTIQDIRKQSQVMPYSNLTNNQTIATSQNAGMSLQEIAEDRSRVHQSVLNPTVNKSQAVPVNRMSSIEKNLGLSKSNSPRKKHRITLLDQKPYGLWESERRESQFMSNGDTIKNIFEVQDKKIRQFIVKERMKNPLGINAALLKSKQMQK